MSTRAELVEKYKKLQKDLAAAQEKTKNKLLEKEQARAEFDKTEKYQKNLESIAQLVGEVI